MSTQGTSWAPPAEAARKRSRAPVPPATVVALHCSGADRGEWSRLASALSADFELIAPNLIGCGDVAPLASSREFMLLDEVKPILGIIDAAEEPVHLVGHSYGGAVALKAASLRPERVASLTLYEPSSFHILHQLAPKAAIELAEIEGLSDAVSLGLTCGLEEKGAAAFIDYWGGCGAWNALRPAARAAILHWLPMAPLNFQAALNDDTEIATYRHLACPALVMLGEVARKPSRLIASVIARKIGNGALEVLHGAGHMAPFTHAPFVMARIAQFIDAVAHQASAQDWSASSAA